MCMCYIFVNFHLLWGALDPVGLNRNPYQVQISQFLFFLFPDCLISTESLCITLFLRRSIQPYKEIPIFRHISGLIEIQEMCWCGRLAPLLTSQPAVMKCRLREMMRIEQTAVEHWAQRAAADNSRATQAQYLLSATDTPR